MQADARSGASRRAGVEDVDLDDEVVSTEACCACATVSSVHRSATTTIIDSAIGASCNATRIDVTHSAIVSSSSWAGTTTSTDHGSFTFPPHVGSEAGLDRLVAMRYAMLQTRISERFVHLITVQDVISTVSEPVNGNHRAAGTQ